MGLKGIQKDTNRVFFRGKLKRGPSRGVDPATTHTGWVPSKKGARPASSKLISRKGALFQLQPARKPAKKKM